ncbi:hypothetical protein ABC347_13630 [Sphingomonas sp. 1P06PA]|uniref:hypothetical protein n=1 Tax=Sphingomonas sp. 1P06PA TaxID=554121 RepID=UPI0039A54D36
MHDRRGAEAALRRLDREAGALRRRGPGPHHDPVRGRPSIVSIRRRSGFALIVTLIALVVLVGWGMMRFVMWFGALLGSQILPVPAASLAHSVIGIVLDMLAGR